MRKRVKARLHIGDQRIRFGGLTGQRADHADGGSYTPAMSGRIADDDADARIFQLLHLLLGLRHGAHQQYLRLQRDNLLQVGFHAGLHRGYSQHGGGVIAVFTAAYQRISCAQRIENFAVGGG